MLRGPEYRIKTVGLTAIHDASQFRNVRYAPVRVILAILRRTIGTDAVGPVQVREKVREQRAVRLDEITPGISVIHAVDIIEIWANARVFLFPHQSRLVVRDRPIVVIDEADCRTTGKAGAEKRRLLQNCVYRTKIGRCSRRTLKSCWSRWALRSGRTLRPSLARLIP